MNYVEWLKTVPAALMGDPLWRVEAYRLALFAADLTWRDVTKLMQDKRTLSFASQLYEAIGSSAPISLRATHASRLTPHKWKASSPTKPRC